MNTENLPAGARTARAPWGRLLALAGVLLGEYLLISFLFDAKTVSERADWSCMGTLGIGAPLLVVVAAAIWMLPGARLRSELTDALALPRGPTWPFIAAHAAFFAVFLFCTSRIFALQSSSSLRWDWRFVTLWASSGLACMVCLALAALRPRALLRAMARSRGVLLFGLVMGVAAWAAGVVSVELWGFLGGYTLDLVAWMLGRVTDTVIVEKAQSLVGTEWFVVNIAPICSGYEGIGVVAAFLAVHLWHFRRHLIFPRALIIVPIALAAVWTVNAFRIAALIVVGSWWSEEIALGGFHSKAGWVLVCALSLAAIELSRRWKWIWRDHAGVVAGDGPDMLAAAYLLPLLVLVAVRMLTGLFVVDFDRFYALAPIAALAVLLRMRKRLPRLPWSPTWQAPAVGAAVFIMWWAFERYVSPGAGASADLHAAVNSINSPARELWIVGRVVGSMCVVPVVEELAFRGYLLRRIISSDIEPVPFDRFTWASFLVSSFAFGLLHQRWLAGVLGGMAFAGIQYHRGRIADAIVAHAVANGLIALAVLWANQWSMWG
jgi:exosortase E/protease (VPEID-CTERM system)